MALRNMNISESWGKVPTTRIMRNCLPYSSRRSGQVFPALFYPDAFTLHLFTQSASKHLLGDHRETVDAQESSGNKLPWNKLFLLGRQRL